MGRLVLSELPRVVGALLCATAMLCLPGCSETREAQHALGRLLDDMALDERPSGERLSDACTAYCQANGLDARAATLHAMHLPVVHWTARQHPVYPVMLENLSKPGVAALLEVVRLSGEFGGEAETRELYQWWVGLPQERAEPTAWHVLEIIARPRTRPSAELIWGLTKGKWGRLAWNWVAEFHPEHVPLDAQRILESDDGWACYWAARTLERWGNPGSTAQRLYQKARKRAVMCRDEILGSWVRRALQEAKGKKPRE